MTRENKTVADLLGFVEREGMVLESARHASVPNLVEYIVSERVEGMAKPRRGEAHRFAFLFEAKRRRFPDVSHFPLEVSLAFFFLIDSPLSSIRYAPWTIRSRIASASVGFPTDSCHFEPLPFLIATTR